MCTCEHIFCLSEIVQHSVQNCKKKKNTKKVDSFVNRIECVLAKINFCTLFNYFIL